MQNKNAVGKAKDSVMKLLDQNGNGEIEIDVSVGQIDCKMVWRKNDEIGFCRFF